LYFVKNARKIDFLIVNRYLLGFLQFINLKNIMENKQPKMVTLEIATEVANKVGGIYTVLRSKAKSTTERLGDDYCMIGICNERYVAMEVEKMDPTQPEMLTTIKSMRDRGVKVVTGRWLIEGYPKVMTSY